MRLSALIQSTSSYVIFHQLAPSFSSLSSVLRLLHSIMMSIKSFVVCKSSSDHNRLSCSCSEYYNLSLKNLILRGQDQVIEASARKASESANVPATCQIMEDNNDQDYNAVKVNKRYAIVDYPPKVLVKNLT